MNRVMDVLSIVWSALVLVFGVVVLLGILLVGVLLLIPILVFFLAFL